MPRPLSRDSRDIERVMRQISLAVSKSRGVSSLSRAVGAKYAARSDLDTYTASLPRPKLKKLTGSREEKKQILRTKEPSNKYTTEIPRTVERPRAETRDKRGQGQRPRRTNSRSQVDHGVTQNNYYNLYGAPVTSGKEDL